MKMTTADILLIYKVILPSVSMLPSTLPSSTRMIKASHETAMQDMVKTISALSVYAVELVPIIPAVSRIACGFNKDTDNA
ncbi:hypothetical protein BN1048_01445 [Jeotgalicoccus saudimassiliensis]|uniref:Uncharacterized protein n=1 Tax=Jeotgalicoccus saudimassiliensis TaxID=1461582 RepID=A0A078M5W6_9STAP|nr:hypothetical protein BN1048_01445 [Jeotgalicoccus saudimassiliensis]